MIRPDASEITSSLRDTSPATTPRRGETIILGHRSHAGGKGCRCDSGTRPRAEPDGERGDYVFVKWSGWMAAPTNGEEPRLPPLMAKSPIKVVVARDGIEP